MALFDQDRTHYPRRWADMSRDFQLVFIFHVCMMGVMAISAALFVQGAEAIILGLAAFFIFLSLRRRREMRWRWPGAGRGEITKALFTAAMIAFFLFATSPVNDGITPASIAVVAVIINIGLFGVLNALRLVTMSKADFEANCGQDDYSPKQRAQHAVPATAMDPPWKRICRGIFTLAFMAVWLCGVGSFYLFATALHAGLPAPDATHTETLFNHGTIVYITAEQKRWLDLTQGVMMAGIPLVMIGMLLMHFILGVRLLPHAPTLPEILEKRRDGN